MHAGNPLQRLRVFGLLILAVSLIALAPLQAQTASSSGNFAGRVTDKSGALVTGAQIKLTNIETGAARTAPSNSSGMFNFALVSPGTYLLTATKEGFAVSNSAPTPLQVGQTITVNFSMQPGSQTQTVEVTAQAPLVNAAQTGVAGNISPTEVESLPTNGNDFGSLAVLVPGVKPVASYDPTKSRVAVFSVDGGTGRNVNTTVDGVENKDNSVGGPDMQLPMNAVQEFNVSPSRFSAANGRSEGASVNVVEKEGTNKFHGGAQYYFTDTSLNADDYFSKQNGQATPQFDRQQFGADIGGPIRKNKDFFFVALFRDNETTSIPVTAAAQAELTLAEPIGAKPIGVIPTPYHDTRLSTRFDHTINAANQLSLNFNYQTNYGLNDQDGSTVDGTESNFTKNHMILGGLTWNTVISPTTVNSLTLGYQYWGNLIDTSQYTPFHVSFPDGANFGTNGNVPQGLAEKKWEFRDDLSMNRGRHALKFGEDFAWEPQMNGFFEFNAVPTISFADSAAVITSHGTSAANPNFTYTDGFATPGAVTSMSLATGDPYYTATNGIKYWGFYAEDDWQATQKLTLNLGVRYELDYNSDGQNDMANNRTYLALKAINSPYAKLPQTDYGDLAPIFGFTYDLNGHGTQLLRGGFGMYYGEVFQNQTIFALQQTDPTLFSTVFSASLTGGPGGACGQCTVPGTSTPLNQWALGVDPNPVWTGAAPKSLSAGASGSTLDGNFRNPLSEQFNLGYTWGLSPNSAVMVDYVHELGLHEMRTQNINPPTQAAFKTQKQIRTYDAAFTAAGLPDLGAISDYSTFGRSRFDSVDVEYKRRMTRNFSLDASYTLERALAWGGSAASFGGRTVSLNYWDPVNFGPAGTDQRHRIVFSGIINLPWGLNLAPIVQWASAPPYSASEGSGLFGYSSGFSNPYAIVPNSDPTDYTYIPDQQKQGQQELVLGSNGFPTLPCLQAGTCHELSINALRGQSFFDTDARVGKRVRLGEWGSVNLFFQAFDLTNRANFGPYNGTITSSNFGKPTGYISGSGVTIPKAFRGEFGAEFTF